MRRSLRVHVTVKLKQRPFPVCATLLLSNARFSPNAKEFSRGKTPHVTALIVDLTIENGGRLRAA